MTLIRVSSKQRQEEYRSAGLNLPKRIYTYLTLYALSNGVTRSVIVRELLEKWIAEKGEDDIINKLVEKLRIEWLAQRSIKKNTSFHLYEKELREWLMKKGIGEEYIKNIIRGIRDEEKVANIKQANETKG